MHLFVNYIKRSKFPSAYYKRYCLGNESFHSFGKKKFKKVKKKVKKLSFVKIILLRHNRYCSLKKILNHQEH